ncbi:MAG: Holliday junction DNA helicase RuvA [Desulfotignum sp.]|nr:Holliday junction DNA helicase RuvA [Desulfotignum sp.]
MIGYLEGRIIHCESDAILLLAGQVGYEVLVSPFTMEQVLAESGTGDDIIHLYIYYHVTERQPKPVLIGFASLSDKAFFQLFISVAAIGPIKAVKALVRPVAEIAMAIEEKQVSVLSKLPGIGTRTAEKIIATLHGKTRGFVVSRDAGSGPAALPLEPEKQNIALLVAGVLVEQLGHSTASAQRMIQAAFEKNPGIHTPEGLLDAIYQEGS